ncbi:membrane-spanning 4-domains subfamily A member 4A-like isoform 1-T2 [Discoglossus pictus]
MSSTQPDAGVVVVTHIQPQINPTDITRAHESANASSPATKPLTKFYRGQPEALGVTQIFAGTTLFVFGIILTDVCVNKCSSVFLIETGLLFWSGIMYIISGSLSVAASSKPTIGKIRSSLVLNILSSVIAAVGIILFILNFLISNRYYSFGSNVYCSLYGPDETCEGRFNPEKVVFGMTLLMFFFTILELCISVSTSVFGCKTVCRTSFNEVYVVIYQTTSMNPAAAPSIDETKNQ